MEYEIFVNSTDNRFIVYLFENGSCIYFNGTSLNNVTNEKELANLYAKDIINILKDKNVSYVNVKYSDSCLAKAEFIGCINSNFKIRKIEDISIAVKDENAKKMHL